MMDSSLLSLFQADPAAQELGLKMIGEDRQMQQARLAQLMQQTDQNAQMFPHQLKQASLGNLTAEKRLPGIEAESSMATDKARFSRETISKAIEAEMSKLQGSIGKQDLEQITGMGNAYSQAGRMLDLMPGVATHAAAREILGKFYRPEFDKITPTALGQTLGYIGDAMISAQGKHQQQLDLLDLKNKAKQEELDKKASAQRSLEEYKATLRANLKSKEGAAKQDPKTARAISNQLFLAAQQEQDSERKAELLSQAQYFNEIAFQEIERRAQAANAGKVDPGAATGLPTIPSPQPPQPMPGMQPQPNQQGGAQKPATLADVQKMYPGVPPEKLREAYKKKFGVDLQ